MLLRKLLILQSSDSAQGVGQGVREAGWEVRVVPTLTLATALASQQGYHVGLVVIEDCNAYRLDDLERLTANQEMEWIAVLSPHCLQDRTFARHVLANFYDYHTLPLDIDRLLVVLGHAYGKNEMKHYLNKRQEWVGRYQMVGRSAPMQELYAKLDRITRVDAPVLIVGESGTGKELVARAIHQHSQRASGPFVPVNCGGLPDNLVQSELFGHEKGAFTGAYQRKIGSIEAAQGGVIFLDEIGDLPLELQANLLRFLQERTIVRVGSTQRIPIDVRVVAATHVDLQKAVAQGRFREDLYYRLNVLHLSVPPLRERAGDMELFAQELFREFHSQKNPAVQGFSQEALRAMEEYRWPGNVRELVNRIQHAMIMSDKRLIRPGDLGLPDPTPNHNGSVISLSTARAATEKDMIRLSLRKNANNVSKTARELGVSRVTLYRLMDKFEIDLKEAS
jgi:DNA-binding NtrC family response regulator